MKTFDRMVAILIVLFGATHAALAPVFRGGFNTAGMWFLSGGLMLIFLGMMNLVRIGSPGGAARWGAFIANVLALAFVVGLVPLVGLSGLGRNPQVTVAIVLIAAATLFSVVRRDPRAA